MTAMARPALLYFLLWLGVTLSTAIDLQKRIFGGQTCGDAERLHHVMLIVGGGLCGGSLIGDRWVLTAAHCWRPGQRIKAYVNVHTGREEEEMDIGPNGVYREPRGHDIMLLRLPRRPEHVYTVDLPTAAQCQQDDLNIGKPFRVAGYGDSRLTPEDKFFNVYPPTLQCIGMTVVDCTPVRVNLRMVNSDIPFGNFFCATADRKETAKGDSGGGVLYANRLHGIVTAGHPTHAFVEPCIFLRVCSYLPWIIHTLANY